MLHSERDFLTVKFQKLMNLSRLTLMNMIRTVIGTIPITMTLIGKERAKNKYKFNHISIIANTGTIMPQKTPEAFSTELTTGMFRINL